MKAVAVEIKQLRASCDERIDCSKPVVMPEMQVKSRMWQGDVGVLRIANLPKGAKECERPAGGQVAPGVTQGARHCVTETEGLTWYRFSGDELSDIAIRADCPWTLTHPEHANVTFQPGLYQFTHQQNEHRERVRD